MEPTDNQSNTRRERVTRRLFLGAAAGATSVLAADEEAAGQGTSGGAKRTRQAYRVRVDTAQLERDTFQPNQTPNGDEEKFASKIGNFSKGLPHNALGRKMLRKLKIYAGPEHPHTAQFRAYEKQQRATNEEQSAS